MEPCILFVPILIAEVVGHYILNPVIQVRQDLRWWPQRFSIGDGVVLAVYLQVVVAVFAAVAPEGNQRELWGIALVVVLLAAGALWSFAMATAEQLQLPQRKKLWLTLVLLPLTGAAMIAAIASVVYWVAVIASALCGGVSPDFSIGLFSTAALYPGPLLLRRFAAWIVQGSAPVGAAADSSKVA